MSLNAWIVDSPLSQHGRQQKTKDFRKNNKHLLLFFVGRRSRGGEEMKMEPCVEQARLKVSRDSGIRNTPSRGIFAEHSHDFCTVRVLSTTALQQNAPSTGQTHVTAVSVDGHLRPTVIEFAYSLDGQSQNRSQRRFFSGPSFMCSLFLPRCCGFMSSAVTD